MIMDQFTESSRNNDDGGADMKWEEENNYLVVRKKRPPSNFDQETFQNCKKLSPENYRDNDQRQAYSNAQMYHNSNNIESVRRSYKKKPFG